MPMGDLRTHIYTKKDIEKAYDLGIEMAVDILEKSVGLSTRGQLMMIKCLKDRIHKGKLKYTHHKILMTDH